MSFCIAKNATRMAGHVPLERLDVLCGVVAIVSVDAVGLVLSCTCIGDVILGLNGAVAIRVENGVFWVRLLGAAPIAKVLHCWLRPDIRSAALATAPLPRHVLAVTVAVTATSVRRTLYR